jgi:hypothetical protein
MDTRMTVIRDPKPHQRVVVLGWGGIADLIADIDRAIIKKNTPNTDTERPTR